MRPKARARKPDQKVRGGMRGFAEARKSNINLLNDVRTHVVAEGNKNANVGREAHKIHVSELIKDDACPRRMYYKISETPVTDPAKGAFHRLEMIWAAGHAEHAKWQRWLREMGVLWGTWKCLVCSYEWEETSPEYCANKDINCLSQLLEYKEVELSTDRLPIVGHADGAVPGRECFVEVKSFSVGTVRIENPELVKEHTHKVDDKTIIDIDAIWKSIVRPLKSHLRQGLMYLWMAEQMGLPYKSIVFIYENKANQDTKAFEVTRSDRLIAPYIETVEAVLEYVEDGVVPPRPDGFVPDGRPCNECPFKSHCWSDDDQSSESARVPSRRSRQRSRSEGRETTVRPAREAETGDAPRSRRRDRVGRPRTDGDADADPEVGGALRRATVDGGGGREVGRVRSGQGTGSRFSRSR